jgi:hypothetical protein
MRQQTDTSPSSSLVVSCDAAFRGVRNTRGDGVRGPLALANDTRNIMPTLEIHKMRQRKASTTMIRTSIMMAMHQVLDADPKILDDPFAARGCAVSNQGSD